MATPQEIATIRQRGKKASARLDLWRSALDTVYHFIRPNHNMWSDDKTEGTDRAKDVYDLTSMNAVGTFVGRVHNTLTPPFFNFASQVPGHEIMRFEEQFPEDVKRFRELLEKNTKIIFDYIQNSNFNLEVTQCYYDLAVGTMALMVLEGSDNVPLRFHCVSPRELAFEENAFGFLTNVWRFIKDIKVDDINKLWPKADTKSLKARSLDNPELQEVTLTEAVLDLSDFDKSGEWVEKYRKVLYEETTGEVLLDEQIVSSPWIIARWSRFPGYILGTGPAFEATSTVLTVNKMVEYELIGNAFRSTPAWLGFADDVFNPWMTRIKPNTIIPMNATSADTPPLQELKMSGDVRFTQLQIQELRQQINDVLLANPLGQPLGPFKTATEQMLRFQQLDEKSQVAIGRLAAEFIEPLFSRVSFILQKRGLIDAPPKIDGKTIRVQYRTPLATAQGTSNAEQFLSFYNALVGTVGQQGALMSLNLDKIPGYFAEQYSIQEDLIKSEDEMAIQQQQMQQMVQAISQAQIQSAKEQQEEAA